MPTEFQTELNKNFKLFKSSGKDIESYFDRQIIFIHHSQTNRLDLKVKCTEIYNTVVFVPVIYGKTFFYGNVQIESLKSDHPIRVSNIEKLPRFLGYGFSLEDCSENGLSVEYYKLKPRKKDDCKNLIGYNSNSVPGKCVKWDKKLRLGVFNDNFYWLPSENLILNQLYCDRDDCLMSFHFNALVNRHKHICSNLQKIKTKQKVYGDSREELELLIELGYLPSSFKTFRLTNMAVFDIECLESKVYTAVPDFGNTILANQVACSIGRWTYHIDNFNVIKPFIGVASNIGDCEEKVFVRKSSAAEHGQEMVDNFLDYLLGLLKVIFYQLI